MTAPTSRPVIASAAVRRVPAPDVDPAQGGDGARWSRAPSPLLDRAAVCVLRAAVPPLAALAAAAIAAGVVAVGVARRLDSLSRGGWCPLCDVELLELDGSTVCPSCAWTGGDVS